MKRIIITIILLKIEIPIIASIFLRTLKLCLKKIHKTVKKKMIKLMYRHVSSCSFYKTFNRKIDYISFVIVWRENRDRNLINRPALFTSYWRKEDVPLICERFIGLLKQCSMWLIFFHGIYRKWTILMNIFMKWIVFVYNAHP